MKRNTGIVIIISIIMLIMITGGMLVLIYHVANFSVAQYSTIEGELVYSMEYLGKKDTLVFLEIASLLILSMSVSYAGLLNYLKDSKKEKKPEKKFRFKEASK